MRCLDEIALTNHIKDDDEHLYSNPMPKQRDHSCSHSDDEDRNKEDDGADEKQETEDLVEVDPN